MGVLIGQREFSESEIDKIIFRDHSSVAFDLVKFNDICRFKYNDGVSLIDKLCFAFKDSVIRKDSSAFYYRKLIFDVLTNGYCYSKKLGDIIKDFEQFYKMKLDRNFKDYACSLVNELKFFKRHIDGERITERDKKVLQKSFGVKENFSHFIEKSSELSYPFIGVSKLSNKSIITIDSKPQTACDDAISIRKTHYGYLLAIYISDVASYVCDNTLLYEHAFQRGESIYTCIDNNSYIPMFPHEITRDFFSLNSGCYRKVVGHFFKISNNFELIKTYIKPVKVKISRNYTFHDIERIKSDDSNYDMIYLLLKLIDGLKSYFNLDHDVNKNGYCNSVGSNIIEFLTLFLNSYISDIMNKNDYPFIYKVNDSILSLGLFSNDNCYGKVSTPIRSFASLLNQYFELSLLVNSGNNQEFVDEWNEKLPEIVEKLNTRLFLNSEYCDAIEKIYGKQLTKKR